MMDSSLSVKSGTVRVACLQMNSTDDVEENWKVFERLASEAISEGAQWICTPENTFYLGGQFHKVALAEPVDGQLAQRCSQFATTHSVQLFIGSIAEQHRLSNGWIDTERCHNTSLVFAPNGDLTACYRKIHLFDVDIPNGLTIAESDRVVPGESAVVVQTDEATVGLSICYDLRFPEQYRQLQDLGAEVMLIPSAFTYHTGKAHWHTLVQARAIETQSWVIASAQTGTHDREGKRRSFGHSLIVDPWGRVVADAGQSVGYVVVDMDLNLVRSVRQSMPVQQHRRL